jgi:hypothetical protein
LCGDRHGMRFPSLGAMFVPAWKYTLQAADK